jgi:predicted nucleic acid-binding protein
VILSADTSSLVKRYVGEPHRDEVLTWLSAADAVATSRVAYPEIAAALGARQRRGDIAAAEVRGLVDTLFETWDDYLIVDLDELRAADLALDHGLRGFDAIHLAAALTLRDALGHEGVVFSSFDTRLNRAAAAEGLIVLEAASN